MHHLAVICLISSLGLVNRDRRINSACSHVQYICYKCTHDSNSKDPIVRQKPNERMTAIAPAPASEDKEDVISVSALLAHTHTLTQTRTKQTEHQRVR